MSEKTEGEIAITSDAQTIMDVIGDLPAYPEWAEDPDGLRLRTN